MNKGLLACLVVVLTASVFLNGYLWLSLNQAVDIATSNSMSDYEKIATYKENAVNAEGTKRSTSTDGEGNSEGVISSTNNARAYREAGISETNIDALHQLLSSGNYALLNQQLNYELQRFPNNEDLLLLEAELVLRTQPLSEALIYFHDLAELPLSPNMQDNVESRITSLYDNAQKELKANRQWDLVASLNEPLFQRVPDNRRYTLQLAEAYARQQKITLMEDVLASLAYDDNAANAIRNIAYRERNYDNEVATDETLARSELLVKDVTRVALLREGDQYRVNVEALNQTADMVLDTGASTTAITTDLFNRLGGLGRLTFIGNFDVNTASGTINAPLVHIPSFLFAGYRFKEVSALVLPTDALPNADGLLGMNILGKFDFSISPQDSELTLKVREESKALD
ncbi:peptidase A2 [Alteromonas sp. KS69]|jgi:clan AA aspartic protease (TIGR02281 family)|uniref:retropepsin-like aspartic protease family protein n=2 Tax=Alteromonas TaxID=226 RepID=UPI000F865AFA|nr:MULTISPECIES: retropepsin-like aspartic protease [unclassified Alteromonas]MBO7922824.1 clan AA aspartic protease [Alteromonas sp. K632G]RUP83852.1 peptidase A2 [Alteromonas sp. KS69]|tara:strand:+ start:9444 stop:10646 length:1203 start_codon:yes stop_codon:yes gene_type:complete